MVAVFSVHDEVVFRSHKLMVDDSLAKCYLKEGVLRSLDMYNHVYYA